MVKPVMVFKLQYKIVKLMWGYRVGKSKFQNGVIILQFGYKHLIPLRSTLTLP